MSEIDPPLTPDEIEQRCPHCDSVVAVEATQCLMCGMMLETAVPEPVPQSENIPAPVIAPTPRQKKNDNSKGLYGLIAAFAIIIFILSYLVLRYQSPFATAEPVVLIYTATPIPPSSTPTLTPTPSPTGTTAPTQIPTMTSTPLPTVTSRPDRLHIISSGETLFGLSLSYDVSVDVIAQNNGLDADSPVQVNQSLNIPWPTPTPPLEAVAVEINGEQVVAVPDGCPRHEIQSGESIAGIANQYGVPFALLLRVNRLTEETVVQPGQTVCIPEVRFASSLPPTAGPSPTIGPTRFPAGPDLLYPADGTVFEADGVVRLQWTAVKDLSDSEWYMVELVDLNAVDTLPYRGFTRDNSLAVSAEWRPLVVESHLFRWRVSIVQVSDFRDDGQPIYSYGGSSSRDAFFSWVGAVPDS